MNKVVFKSVRALYFMTHSDSTWFQISDLQCVKSQMKRESIFIVIYLKHAVLMSEETEPHLGQSLVINI